MEKYIALLRGINVGGKNKIPMPALRTVFEDLGFSEVATYINSGNVVFSSEVQDKSELIKKCETAVAEKFKLDIPIEVVSAEDLAETLRHAPDWWGREKEIVHYAIFVMSPVSAAEVFAEVGEIKPEFEKISHHGSVIFWSAPLKTFSKARWSKIASSAVNNHVTIRNANTVKKLLQMSEPV